MNSPVLSKEAQGTVVLLPGVNFLVDELVAMKEYHTAHPDIFASIVHSNITNKGTMFLIQGQGEFLAYDQLPPALHLPALAAYIRLIHLAILDGFYVTGSLKNGIVFHLMNGKVDAKATGNLAKINNEVAPYIKNEINKIITPRILDFLGKRQHVNFRPPPTAKNGNQEKTLHGILNKILALYQNKKAGFPYNHLKKMLKKNMTTPLQPTPQPNENGRRSEARPVGTESVVFTNNGRAPGNVPNNNAKSSNVKLAPAVAAQLAAARGNAGGAAGAAAAAAAAAAGAKGGNQYNGILHGIGEILKNHGGNNNDRNVPNNNTKKNVKRAPWYLRSVYGPRRAQRVMERRAGNTNNTNTSPVGFRTMTFAPMKSFVPRHH